MSATTAVITRDQARQITHGRTPLVPVEYEEAVKNLQACSTLDEAKYWSDKSDALAAWAKIYRNDKAGREARRLKLHAYRRMGEIAHELRPRKSGAVKGAPAGSGNLPGAPALLKQSGLQQHEADACSAIAKIPQRKFERYLNSDRPPAPSSLLAKFSSGASEAWRTVSGVHGGQSVVGFAGWCRGKDAKALAKGLTADERERARKCAAEIAEWIDEFEAAISKAKA